MSIVVAELETLLTADASPGQATMDAFGRELTSFAARDFGDAKLDLDITAAQAALKQMRGELEAFQREASQAVRLAVTNTTAANTTQAPVALAAGMRPSSIKPEKIAATTMAAVEQITRVTEAKAQQSARAAEGIATTGAAKAAAIRAQGEARAQSQVEAIRARGEARLAAESEAAERKRQSRLEQIRTEFETRQQLRAQAAANRAPASLDRRARSLRYNGQEDVETGAMLSAMTTAPLLAAAGAALKIGISFEDAFTGVEKTVDATDAELKQLERTLRDMAAGGNPIPITVEELSGIAEAAGQLGVEVPNIAGFTRVMADLGKTTNMTSAQAADRLARLANIVQMPQDQFDRLGSTIVDLGNKTAATESEITEMSVRLAGAGHQVNMSAAEITAFGAALASVGEEAEAGGTAFSRVFLGMDEAVRDGGKTLNLFAKVAGVSSKEFSQTFKEDAAAAVIQFIEGLGRMQKAGGNVAGTLDKLSLGEIRVRDALLRAAGAGDLFTNAIQIGTRAWEENTALTTEAEKRYRTTSSQLVILTNRLREQGNEIAAKVLPALNGLLDAYGDDIPRAIGATAEAFSSLPGPVQEATFALTALVALAGPAKLMAGNLRLLASAATGVWAAAAANPAVAVAAVIALAGGYLVLRETFDKITAAEAETRIATEGLNAAFVRMLEVLPNGSKYVGEIKKIREEIAAAGTDVDKLNEASAKLNNLKSRVNIEVKSPDLKLVFSKEIEEVQSFLNRKTLATTVLLKPVWQQAATNFMQAGGMYPKNIEMKTDVRETEYYRAIGPGVDWFYNNLIGGGLGDDYQLTGQSHYDAMDALNRGHKATMAAKERMARDRANAKPGDLPTKFTVPTMDEALGPVEAGRRRLQAAKQGEPSGTPTPAPFGGVAGGDSEKEREKAERARERAERALNRARELQRTRWAQSLEDSAKPWEQLDGIINGLGTQVNEFDAKTEGARIRARLLRGEFEGIPEPILAAIGHMAKLTDEIEAAGKARDGLRDSNAGTLSELLKAGANTAPFLAAVRNQEAAYNFGGKIDNLRTRASAIGLITSTAVQSEWDSRTSRARALREANDADNLAPLKGKAAASEIVALAEKVHKQELPKFKQTCAWAVSEIYKQMGVSIQTQNNNWAANLKNYAAKHWRQVDAATAPPGALLAEPSEDANSGWHVTVSTGGLNRAGSNKKRPQFGRARRNALAFVPPELDVPAPPKNGGNARKTVAQDEPDIVSGLNPERPAGGPASGSLLPFTEKQLQEFLRAWGPVMTEGGGPGESRQVRLSKQDELLRRMADGEKFTPAQIRAERRAANTADDALARANATTAMTRAVREATTADEHQIKVLREAQKAYEASGGSMAAYQRAAYLAQKEVEIYGSEHIKALWKQQRFAEANKAAREQMQSAADAYDAGEANNVSQAAVQRTQQLADETAAIVEQRALLAQSVGKPETELARGMEEITNRYAEYRRLINEEAKTPDVAMAIATEYAAQLRLNSAAREALDIRRQLNQTAARDQDALGAAGDEAELINSGMGRGDREREIARRNAVRARYREVEPAVASGQMNWMEAAAAMAQASNNAVAQYDAAAGGRRAGSAADADQAHRDRIELLRQQLGAAGAARPGSPDLENELRLLERKFELEAENRNLSKTERFDVDARLKQYAEEINAEEQLARLMESRRNLSESQEQTLQLQKEHELLMARTAAERLEIEQRYSNLLAARRGIEVSPEELAEQAKHRDLETVNESLGQWNNRAGQFRDIVADAMENGTRDGFTRALKSAVFQRLATTITNGLLGSNLGNDGDIFSIFSGKPKAASTPPIVAPKSPTAAPSILEQVRGRNRLQIAPEIAASFLPSKLRRAAEGAGLTGGEGGPMQFTTAEIHIQTATEYIDTATINTNGGSRAGAGGGPDSRPSGEQAVGSLIRLFT